MSNKVKVEVTIKLTKHEFECLSQVATIMYDCDVEDYIEEVVKNEAADCSLTLDSDRFIAASKRYHDDLYPERPY